MQMDKHISNGFYLARNIAFYPCIFDIAYASSLDYHKVKEVRTVSWLLGMAERQSYISDLELILN